jgi:hypothetical protein
MARRRGRGATGRDRGRSSDPSDYYGATESDAKYRQRLRERLRHNAIRRWIIRLSVLAVLAIAGSLWGPSLVTALRVKAKLTENEFQAVGDNVRQGAARRGGAEWVEGSP